jgi:hypothetical protein
VGGPASTINVSFSVADLPLHNIVAHSVLPNSISHCLTCLQLIGDSQYFVTTILPQMLMSYKTSPCEGVDSIPRSQLYCTQAELNYTSQAIFTYVKLFFDSTRLNNKQETYT